MSQAALTETDHGYVGLQGLEKINENSGGSLALLFLNSSFLQGVLLDRIPGLG